LVFVCEAIDSADGAVFWFMLNEPDANCWPKALFSSRLGEETLVGRRIFLPYETILR
jgi:hypothetical protein